jgi:hypothetical protein
MASKPGTTSLSKDLSKINFLQVTKRNLGSHGGEYEDGCLVGCWALWTGRILLTFQRCLLPPLSGWWLIHRPLPDDEGSKHLWNSPSFTEPEVLLSCSKESTTGPYLSHYNPIYTLKPHSLKIHFNIILQSASMPFEWSLPFWRPKKKVVGISHLPMRATCPAHFTVPYKIKLITFTHHVAATYAISFATCRMNDW